MSNHNLSNDGWNGQLDSSSSVASAAAGSGLYGRSIRSNGNVIENLDSRLSDRRTQLRNEESPSLRLIVLIAAKSKIVADSESAAHLDYFSKKKVSTERIFQI